MMDEIDLQLCLSIDPATQTPDTPDTKLRRRKRSTRSFDLGGGDSEWGPISSLRDSHNQAGVNGSGKGGGDELGIRHQEQVQHRGGYLSLPPRKKVRSSLSLSSIEGKGQMGFGDIVDDCERNTTGTVDLKAVSFPEIARDSEKIHPDQSRIDDEGNTQEANMEVDMDVESDGGTDAVEEIPPQSQHQYHHILPSLVGFTEPVCLSTWPYIPTPPRPDPVYQAEPFEIYEDPLGPEIMDIDLAYFIDPSWYLSPDDDKENLEEAGQQQHSNELEYTREQDYHLTYADHGAHDSSTPIESQPYHNNTIISSQDTIVSGDTRDSSGTLWLAGPRSSMSHELGIDQNTVHQFTFLNDTPIPSHISALPEEDSTDQHSLLSPTSLSATEISLRALPSQTSANNSPNNPENNLRSRPRRIIRSVNFV